MIVVMIMVLFSGPVQHVYLVLCLLGVVEDPPVLARQGGGQAGAQHTWNRGVRLGQEQQEKVQEQDRARPSSG